MPQYTHCVTTLMIQNMLGIHRSRQYQVTRTMNYEFKRVVGGGNAHYIPIDLLPDFLGQVISPEYGKLLKDAAWAKDYTRRVEGMVNNLKKVAVKVPA